MSVFSFTQNPIARAESATQQQLTPPSFLRRGLGYAIRIALTVVSLFLLGTELAAVIVGYDPTILMERFLPVVEVYLVILVALHFRVMIATLSMTVAALERERKHAERWESLVLTGIPARAIVLGKWWALVKARWREYAWLALWRSCAAIWLGAWYSRSLMTSMASMSTSYNTTSNSSTINFTLVPPSMVQFGIAILIIVVLTMANLLFTTACAVYAGMAYKRVAMMAAIMSRFLMIVFFSGGMLAIFCSLSTFTFMNRSTSDFTADSSTGFSAGVSTAFSLGLGTLYDNGATLAGATVTYSLAEQTYGLLSPTQWITSLSFVFSLLFYGVLTIIALLMAQAQAERFGALKSAEVKSN